MLPGFEVILGRRNVLMEKANEKVERLPSRERGISVKDEEGRRPRGAGEGGNVRGCRAEYAMEKVT